MTYDEARLEMADWLERNATNSPNRPHDGYAVMDASIARGSESHWNKIFVALQFWDGWIDASNHEWRYYEPIMAADWPKLAREIAGALRADCEITNPVVLDRFGIRGPAQAGNTKQ